MCAGTDAQEVLGRETHSVKLRKKRKCKIDVRECVKNEFAKYVVGTATVMREGECESFVLVTDPLPVCLRDPLLVCAPTLCRSGQSMYIIMLSLGCVSVSKCVIGKSRPFIPCR